jgi:hypothetical protein
MRKSPAGALGLLLADKLLRPFEALRGVERVAVAELIGIAPPLGYRNAWVTHEPRCSCIGPSLTFAIIAAPNTSAKNVSTTKSRQFHAMLPSLFRT